MQSHCPAQILLTPGSSERTRMPVGRVVLLSPVCPVEKHRWSRDRERGEEAGHFCPEMLAITGVRSGHPSALFLRCIAAGVSQRVAAGDRWVHQVQVMLAGAEDTHITAHE